MLGRMLGNKLGIMVTGLYIPLISFLPFLRRGIISAKLRFLGNFVDIIELLMLTQRKLLKI